MCNHLESRSRKLSVIKSRFNLPASQCIPVCGATFRKVRRRHYHVLILTNFGQAFSLVGRMHKVVLSTSRHGLSLSKINASRSGCCTCPTCKFKSPPTTTQHLDRAACTILSAQSDNLSVAQPPSGVKLRRLWRGNFSDLQGFAKLRPACRFCPSSHPKAPPKKVCIQPAHCDSPENNERVVVWYQSRNHMVCLKSEQDLFQSASLPRTHSKRLAGTGLKHAARRRWPALT